MLREKVTLVPLAAGVAVLGAVLSPAAERLAERSLPLHMAQHALLVVVAAPLLARGLQQLAAPAARAGALALVIVLFMLMVMLHIPPVIDLLEGTPVLHAGAHLALLGAAMAVWLFVLPGHAALAPLPRMVYLVVLALAPMGAAVVLSLDLPTFDGALAGSLMAAVGTVFAAVGISGWVLQPEAGS
ncbi:MAG TPA: cytochrome c oxidase assembly protein [Candidatus Dormibacteraeota bacterium]|jgi:cytochrome c oxidase assembly factor CtaG